MILSGMNYFARYIVSFLKRYYGIQSSYGKAIIINKLKIWKRINFTPKTCH